MIPTIQVVRAFTNMNRAFVGGRETGVNDGTFVRWIQKQTGNAPPDPWCSSMQAKAGYGLLRELWPVPLTASCQALGEWATRNGCLFEEPAVGALHLLWHEKDSRGPRFAHVACVLEVLGPKKVHNAEGNTSEKPGISNEGTGCFEKTRDVASKDRFVYWWLAMKTET